MRVAGFLDADEDSFDADEDSFDADEDSTFDADEAAIFDEREGVSWGRGHDLRQRLDEDMVLRRTDEGDDSKAA